MTEKIEKLLTASRGVESEPEPESYSTYKYVTPAPMMSIKHYTIYFLL